MLAKVEEIVWRNFHPLTGKLSSACGYRLRDILQWEGDKFSFEGSAEAATAGAGADSRAGEASAMAVGVGKARISAVNDDNPGFSSAYTGRTSSELEGG